MNLPDPKYTVEDPAGKHKYVINHPTLGTIGPLKSVTKIVGVLDKPALIGWAASEAAKFFKAELLRTGAAAMTPDELDRIASAATGAHRRKAKDAADLGTACHAIFEAIVANKEPEQIPAELAEPAKDFKRWRLSTDIEIVAQELPVGSARLQFGGRLDVIGYSKSRDGFGIVDYKTSSGFYGNEYAYQVGGYALAVEEQYGIKVDWAEIVRFGKKPPFDSEARPVVDMQGAKAAFERLVAVSAFQDEELIGAPSFTTAAARAAEAPAVKAQKVGLGF
jgi:hypothetical protein